MKTKTRNRSNFKSIMSKIILIFITIMIVTVGAFSISPRPMAYVAKKLIFDPTPNKKSPDNLDEILTKITIDTDIEYESDYGSNTFDIYQAKDNKEPLPVIVWAHGGGFVGGDKFMLSDYSSVIASQGYAVVTFNYSTAPKNKYPTPIIQVNDLIDHLISNQKEYNIDMNKIVFAGDSAGAQIVSQYVISQTNENYNSTINIDKKLSGEQIKGMLLYCGIYDIEDLLASDNAIINYIYKNLGWAYLGEKDWSNSNKLDEASILNNLNENFPPSYITDGNTMSFESSAKALSKRLDDLNIENINRFFSKDNGDIFHEFQFNLQSDEGQLVLSDTIEFLSSILKNSK